MSNAQVIHWKMAKPFQGKVVIITGSSRGIGKAIAFAFAEQGAAVVLNARTRLYLDQVEQEMEELGYETLVVQGDISQKEVAEKLIHEVVEHFGRIDYLINNAGLSSSGQIGDVEPEVFEKLFRINFLGSALPTQAALPFITESNGSIVFISSLAGLKAVPFNGAYSASKMPLTSFADSLRLEYAEANIHVGIAYVGFVQNDPDKQIIQADGSFQLLGRRKNIQAPPPEQIATKIVEMIAKRKKRMTFTTTGKLLHLLLRFFPNLMDRYLLLQRDKFRLLYLGQKVTLRN